MHVPLEVTQVTNMCPTVVGLIHHVGPTEVIEWTKCCTQPSQSRVIFLVRSTNWVEPFPMMNESIELQMFVGAVKLHCIGGVEVLESNRLSLLAYAK